MQIQFELSFADFLAAQYLHATRNFIRRLLRIINFYIFPLFGVCMLCLAISIWSDRSPALVMCVCSFVLIGYPAYYRIKMFQCYKRTRSGDGACGLTIEESGIRMASANSKSEMSWPAFRSFRENDTIYLLYTAPGKFLVIPKRACSPEQVEEIRSLVTRHLKTVDTERA